MFIVAAGSRSSPKPPASSGLGCIVPKSSDTPRRILLVEDEAILALMLEQDVVEAGYVAVGPFRDLETAFRAAIDEPCDAAILDINLDGERSYPVAEELAKRGIPFLFLSGYGAESMPEKFRGCLRLAKPYDPVDIVRMLDRIA